MKSSLWLGEIRPRSSEMLQTQREIFAKAKVISNKHKIVGVDVPDDPLLITNLFVHIITQFCVYIINGLSIVYHQHVCVVYSCRGQTLDDPLSITHFCVYGITLLCVWASTRRPVNALSLRLAYAIHLPRQMEAYVGVDVLDDPLLITNKFVIDFRAIRESPLQIG